MTKFSRRTVIAAGAGLSALSTAGTSLAAASNNEVRSVMQAKPVLVFDVNETLLDIDSLNPLFDRIFGAPGRMREWFAQLILYSEAITLSGRYAPFGALGAGVLRMLGKIHGVTIRDADVDVLRTAIANLPVHAEVPAALKRLKDAGYRLVTLTNTAPGPTPDPLTAAGLGPLFERRFTVDPLKKFKPAPEVYRQVTEAMGVPPASACMIAAHTWDTIGAQAMGWLGILITRGVNAEIEAPDVPKPDIIVTDIAAAADRIIARWG
jgi:2-haloacid dehalogenase